MARAAGLADRTRRDLEGGFNGTGSLHLREERVPPLSDDAAPCGNCTRGDLHNTAALSHSSRRSKPRNGAGRSRFGGSSPTGPHTRGAVVAGSYTLVASATPAASDVPTPLLRIRAAAGVSRDAASHFCAIEFVMQAAERSSLGAPPWLPTRSNGFLVTVTPLGRTSVHGLLLASSAALALAVDLLEFASGPSGIPLVARVLTSGCTAPIVRAQHRHELGARRRRRQWSTSSLTTKCARAAGVVPVVSWYTFPIAAFGVRALGGSQRAASAAPPSSWASIMTSRGTARTRASPPPAGRPRHWRGVPPDPQGGPLRSNTYLPTTTNTTRI